MSIWVVLTLIVMIIAFAVYCMWMMHAEKSECSLISLFTVFIGVWFLVLILGTINAYGLKPVSGKTYMLLFLGILFWIFGFFTTRFKKKNGSSVLKQQNRSSLESEYTINTTAVYLYIIVITIFLVMIGGKLLVYVINNHTYAQFHKLAFGQNEESLFASSKLNQLYNRVMYPMALSLLPVITVSFFVEGKKTPVIVALIEVLAYCVLVGRRFPMMYLGLYFVLVIPLYKSSLPKKSLKKIICAVVIMFLLVVTVTVMRKRTNAVSEIVKNFYTYFNLCLQVCDHWIEYIDEHYADVWMYGYSCFRGVLNNLDFVFRQVGIRIFNNSEWYELTNLAEKNFINVGGGINANAFATWVYFFYWDLREIGIVIGSYVFGLFAGRIEREAFSKKSIINIVFYLLVAEAVLKSFVRLEFNDTSYVIAFIFLRLLLKKKNTEKTEKMNKT